MGNSLFSVVIQQTDKGKCGETAYPGKVRGGGAGLWPWKPPAQARRCAAGPKDVAAEPRNCCRLYRDARRAVSAEGQAAP